MINVNIDRDKVLDEWYDNGEDDDFTCENIDRDVADISNDIKDLARYYCTSDELIIYELLVALGLAAELIKDAN